MPVDFTLPPDTRAVGIGNPPQDIDNIVDALTAMGGGSNVLNAAYSGGADPTGTADSTAALQAAGNAGIGWLPPGTYLTSSPITLSTAGGGLSGGHGRWYHGAAGGAVIKPSASFSGAQVINITANEVEIGNLTVDCSNLSGTTIDGIDGTGNITNGYLHDLLIRNAPGYGFQAVYSSGSPFTWNFRKVIVDGTLGHAGFNVSNMTDVMFDNCYAIGCAAQGWYLYGNGNTILSGCRAEWSGGGVGYQIDGAVGQGFRMIGCSTDRNSQDGVKITATGTDPIVISGMVCHRDGASSTTQYAGVTIASGTTNRVIIDGLAVYTGKNDDGTGNASPFQGMAVGGVCTHIAVSSAYLNGVSAGQSGLTSTNHVHTRMVYTEPSNPPSGTVTYLTDVA